MGPMMAVTYARGKEYLKDVGAFVGVGGHAGLDDLNQFRGVVGRVERFVVLLDDLAGLSRGSTFLAIVSGFMAVKAGCRLISS